MWPERVFCFLTKRSLSTLDDERCILLSVKPAKISGEGPALLLAHPPQHHEILELTLRSGDSDP